jgi:hypothetical protein
MTSWDDYLTELNRKIDSAFASIESDEPLDPALVDVWSPPTDLEELTPQFKERVAETMKRYSKLEIALDHYAENLRKNISELNRRSGKVAGANSYAEQNVSQYFDQKA